MSNYNPNCDADWDDDWENTDLNCEVGVLYFFENKKVERGILYCSDKCQSEIEGKFDDGSIYMKKITMGKNIILMELDDLSDFGHFIRSPGMDINSKLFHCNHGSNAFSTELEYASEFEKPHFERLMRMVKEQKNS